MGWRCSRTPFRTSTIRYAIAVAVITIIMRGVGMATHDAMPTPLFLAMPLPLSLATLLAPPTLLPLRYGRWWP